MIQLIKRQKIWLLIVLVTWTSFVHAQKKDTLRVLFVGNSFTYFFNLPQVVSSMAETQGQVIITRQSTVGGSNLEQHWKGEKGTKTREILDNGQWDYVVFNNHSSSAIDTPESFMDYGQKFAKLVRQKGAEPVWMMTWAYKSNPLMQDAITEAYKKLASITKSDYVPCGPLYASVRSLRPDMELFHDDKHPSSNGTYLLGLAFYKYFFGLETNGIPERLTTTDIDGEKLYLIFMTPSDADFLQKLVDDFTISERRSADE
ncbi:hypothetical protein SAMN04488029_2630 [Reichenbachiella faecimaris]|uniref:SGNH/GDSL hydrolase family protein n=1 Tax=Reichenbachiella faecimaris TaxID=692418 RepID=A0A1W2GH28_REIFA|nr:DUF4886 domain-containing protein [Reichenbachiella faecimaris]SMD35960.1 hypothetical protein SAMN04488029_2630 [Reichenbachiella faecimaris]